MAVRKSHDVLSALTFCSLIILPLPYLILLLFVLLHLALLLLLTRIFLLPSPLHFLYLPLVYTFLFLSSTALAASSLLYFWFSYPFLLASLRLYVVFISCLRGNFIFLIWHYYCAFEFLLLRPCAFFSGTSVTRSTAICLSTVHSFLYFLLCQVHHRYLLSFSFRYLIFRFYFTFFGLVFPVSISSFLFCASSLHSCIYLAF